MGVVKGFSPKNPGGFGIGGRKAKNEKNALYNVTHPPTFFVPGVFRNIGVLYPYIPLYNDVGGCVCDCVLDQGKGTK